MEASKLVVYPVQDYTMGPYNFYVVTPEDDYMYFQEKKKAREFIEFYHDYVTRHPQKVKRSTPTNGTNNRTKDEQ
jgi:hypothetical protein